MSETWQPDDRDASGNGFSFRGLSSLLMGRANFANWSGVTFGGARDLFRALGYSRKLTPAMYRWRYDRGGIAARLVESKAKGTWREGGTLIEDEDPDTETTFEKAWMDLDKKFRIWPLFEQVDILAGLGQFAIILIGGQGDITTPLTTIGSKGLLYLRPYSQRDVQVESLETDRQSPRFGQPLIYNCSRMTSPLANGTSATNGRIHYSRVVHVADGLLDDQIFGQPRLERVWNLLDDLDKVVGGGAEAFWKRVDAGLQLKMDPTIGEMKPEDKKKLDEQLEEYTDGLRRILKTRGIDIQQLSSQVSGLKDPVDTVISLLAAATGIPQRILMGSERGELASTQDRDEWSERIADRRVSYASPMIVRPFVDRMIELGVLPEPKEYEARWPAMKALDELQKVEVAKNIAQMNQYQGEAVVTTNEIRDRWLDLPPIEEVLSPEELALRNAPPPVPPVPGEVVPPAKPGAVVPPTPKPKPVPTPQRRAAKWAVLTVPEKARYLMRVAKLRQTVERVPITPSLPSEERALTSALAAALTVEDRALAERLIANAIAGIAPVAALPAVVESATPVAPVTIQMGANGSIRRIEYQKIDGIMRPSRIIEETTPSGVQ